MKNIPLDAAALLLGLSLSPWGAVRGLGAAAEPVVLLQAGQARREILPVSRGGTELIELTTLLQGSGVSLASQASPGTLTLRHGGREVTLYQRKSLVAVGGDLRLLSAPVLFEGGAWWLPIDSVPRVLGPLLDSSVTWNETSRVLIVGQVTLPRVVVSASVGADQARVAFEASQKVPFRVTRGEGQVSVAIPGDALDVGFRQERLTGGIVDTVQFAGGKDNAFVITLGRRFQEMKVHEEGNQLVLDFLALPMPMRPAREPGPAQPAPSTPPGPGIKVIVIDPGHGGAEVGAQGPGGVLEKDVTLTLGRKLRAALVSSLGVQAFLTRDGDRDLSLDERTAIANNYKADVFISIHANASRSHGARGSEVFFLSYQASDDESRRTAQLEGGAELPQPAPGSAGDLSLVLWDMAQADHLAESSALASRIQEELAAVTGSESRGVKQAPFRVLVGAAMPAVLVEAAFISNPEEEKALTSEGYQNQLIAAIQKGIARFDREHARRLGLSSSAAREAR